MKKVVEIIADTDDERRKKLELKESKEFFKEENEISFDQVEKLLEASLSSHDYMAKANDIFSMKIAKIAKDSDDSLNESVVDFISVPLSGFLPHKSAPRFIDEVALDTYVKHWNSKQSLQGSSYRLSWSTHPEIENKIKFYLGSK